MREITTLIMKKIEVLSQKKQQILIAIDGRCAAGKTTLAADLQNIYNCNVIHMDHFFLQTKQRTTKRLSQPGGNIDYERFLKEVLIPLKLEKSFSYRPYDCSTQNLAVAIQIQYSPINIIEGSYCCHPTLSEHYDLKIFMTVDKSTQLQRIKNRNGERNVLKFQNRWIPLEERYFSFYHIEENCDFCF